MKLADTILKIDEWFLFKVYIVVLFVIWVMTMIWLVKILYG